jgi:transposase
VLCDLFMPEVDGLAFLREARKRRSKMVVEAIAAKGVEAVIPSLATREEQREYGGERHKGRNLAERFWSNLKQYRRLATRHEKAARNFLAFVHVASIMILLR